MCMQSHVYRQLGFLSDTRDVLNFMGRSLSCLHGHHCPTCGRLSLQITRREGTQHPLRARRRAEHQTSARQSSMTLRRSVTNPILMRTLRLREVQQLVRGCPAAGGRARGAVCFGCLFFIATFSFPCPRVLLNYNVIILDERPNAGPFQRRGPRVGLERACGFPWTLERVMWA